jgi:transmembrane sensor
MSHTFFLNLLAKKMTGEASTEDLNQLESIMKANPDWAYQAEQIQNLWKDESQIHYPDAQLAFEEHLKKMAKAGISFPPTAATAVTSSTGKRNRILVASFLSLTVFFVAFTLWTGKNDKKSPVTPSKKYSEVSSPIGSKTKLVLPDSTVVWLNAGSKLTYNEEFGTVNRNVTLVGEAFFDVKKSTTPFIIHANTVQIKVLGTAFNVKAYPDEKTTETSLLRGRVEITLDKRPGELYILKPNEKLVVANEPMVQKTFVPERKQPIAVIESITHINDSTIIETSWVHNELIFEDETFNDIARKMERWYGITIEFSDEHIANERMSGTFTTETIQEALTALQYSTKFQYSVKGTLITITK